jgi:hypothetical protein
MNLINLDEKTRKFTLNEVETDIKNDRLYLSKRLSEKGRTEYPSLLLDAIRFHDPTWLAEQLGSQGRMVTFEASHSKKGNVYAKHTPLNDNETLAFGEFNRYYIRGLCQRAIDENVEHLIVYRAHAVGEQRLESSVLVGNQINPQELLADLRENVGRNTRLGIPGGPNSGISVKLP